MSSDTAAQLGRLGIFADLTEAQLRDVAAELDERTFPEGGWVLRQGETGTGLFIVVDGEVGSFFGEVSALLGEPVTADVVVRKPLRCLVIPPQRAEEFLLAYPRVMYRMFQIEARRLRTVDPERD